MVKLSNLQELWLDNNQITELPETIGQPIENVILQSVIPFDYHF